MRVRPSSPSRRSQSTTEGRAVCVHRADSKPQQRVNTPSSVWGQLKVWWQQRRGVSSSAEGVELRTPQKSTHAVASSPQHTSENPGEGRTGADPCLPVPTLQSTPAAELLVVQSDLRELLARHPQARTVVPQLAYVLRALGQDGFAALDTAPRYITRPALKQLDLLTGPHCEAGLRILRTRLIAVSFAEEIESSEGALSTLISSLDHSTTGSVVVSESNFAEFVAETEHWEATRRDTGPAPLVEQPSPR